MASNTGVGGPNGPPASAALNRWFRYPAGYSDIALNEVLRRVPIGRHDRVVDPFAGAASMARAVLARQGEFVGIEAHPLIAELAALKLAGPNFIDVDVLLKLAHGIARVDASDDVRSEHPTVAASFDSEQLRELVAMRDAIKALNHRAAPYLKWALLATLRDVATVRVGWPYQRPGVPRIPRYRDARARFMARISAMADDLRTAVPTGRSRVTRGDARLAKTWARAGLEANPADIVLTSPPYLNNFDYADATRLELYFWSEIRSWREMTENVRKPMLVATTQQSRRSRADAAMKRLGSTPVTQNAVAELVTRLAVERRKRPRGKEYDHVLPQYVQGMGMVLKQIRAHVRPGAKVAMVLGDSAPYGVYIDTPRLVADLAEDLGYDTLELTEIRQRGLRWRTNGVRHQVLLSESLVVLRSPSGR